jgi:hypothetical protein
MLHIYIQRFDVTERVCKNLEFERHLNEASVSFLLELSFFPHLCIFLLELPLFTRLRTHRATGENRNFALMRGFRWNAIKSVSFARMPLSKVYFTLFCHFSFFSNIVNFPGLNFDLM